MLQGVPHFLAVKMAANPEALSSTPIGGYGNQNIPMPIFLNTL
jgi:hypothetical protein